MSEYSDMRNKLLSEKIIKGLKSRNIEGYYAETAEEAKEIALSLIPEGSTINMGGAKSVREVGIVDALKAGNYTFIDRDEFEDKDDASRMAYNCDVYLSSCNAMTEDGMLVNIDGKGNRVSAIAFGPKKVIFVVGMNKVCADLDSAMKRARNVAAPINVQRFDVNTPCKKTGACFDCSSPDSICCQFLVTRRSLYADRMHLILVNENLGF